MSERLTVHRLATGDETEPTFRERIGRNLRKFRRQEGYTQARLAQEAGLSRNCIKSLEGYEYQPSLHTAYKLCAVLGIELERLITGRGLKKGER